MTASDSIRVGVLSLHNSKETKAILNAVDDLGHEPIWLREENISLYTDGTSLELRPDIDIVVNRLLLTKGVRPIEDLELAVIYDTVCPVVNNPYAVLTAIHKYTTTWKLVSTGTPMPESLLVLDHARLNERREQLSDCLIQKVAISTNGVGVWKVDDDPLMPIAADRRTFIQEFLESPSDRQYDLRVYVVDGTVIGAMKRHASCDDWRTNVARGGEVEEITDALPGEAGQLAVRATTTLGLDFAGVDLMEQEGEWYVLEVNATAGFKGLFEATNVSVAPYIARVAIERAGGQVDEDRVADIATALDDSTPECKPEIADKTPISTTVGYTEEVVLGGMSGYSTIIAKADTGARRTSIDLELAGEIGAGPIKRKTEVTSGSSKSSTARPLVDITVGIRGIWQTITVSIEDREHMDYQVILGRDVLTNHQIDLQRRADEE